MIPPGNIKSSFVVASLRAGVAVSSFESVLKMILNGRTVAEIKIIMHLMIDIFINKKFSPVSYAEIFSCRV